MRNYRIVLVIASICIVLAGCSFGESTEQKLADTFSKMYDAEQGYRDAQSELSQLENTEQELFSSVMELTQEDTEELTAKATELQQLSDKRLAKVQEERESMDKAKDSVESLNEIVEKAEDEYKNEMKVLQSAVADRYELHASFIDEYIRLWDYQKGLYTMLVDEATEMSELQDKVKEVNVQNEAVLSIINEFNESTRAVNESKEKVFADFTEDK